MLISRSLRRSFDGICPEQWFDATVLLGGGGARGLAHLGAMRAIGQSGLGVGRLVGVSMGALMAALCAVECNVEQAEIRASKFLTSEAYQSLQKRVLGAAGGTHAPASQSKKWSRRWRRRLWTKFAISRAATAESLLPSTILESIVDALLPDIQIEDLATPLQLIAVDLDSGERVVMTSGSLRQSVIASMSIPGVFPLVKIGGRRLGDVGVYDALPCDLVRESMRSDTHECQLIVVDVSRARSEKVCCDTALMSVMRFQELAEQQIRAQQIKQADVVIRPNVGSVAWFDFSNPQPLIDAGFHAAQKSVGSFCSV